MNLPEIRIKNSFLLNSAVVPLLLPSLKESGDEQAANGEFIDKKVKDYTDAWKPYETKILTAMCEVLDLDFKHNVIDAYVSPFTHSFSDPMVIATKYTPDRFIDVFTHEIAHRLLTDNTKFTAGRDFKLLTTWKRMFGEEHSFNTLVHIPVHALLQYVFIDVLNEPERLIRDTEYCKKYEAYDLAWRYVEKNGYLRIIEQLRAYHQTF